MRFDSVECCLEYAFARDGEEHYGQSVLAGWIDEPVRSKPGALTRQDHITQAGMISQRVRETLAPLRYALVVAQHSTVDDRRIAAVAQLVEWAPEPIEGNDDYTADQIARWAGMEITRQQSEWADQLDLSTRSLAYKNKALVKWLQDEREAAHRHLEGAFTRRGWV